MSERDIIRQKIWSLIGDAAIHAHAYTINPAKHRWVMGKKMFELLSEGKGMVKIDPQSGKHIIHEWSVDVENDSEHPYWVYLLGRECLVLKIEINERDFR